MTSRSSEPERIVVALGGNALLQRGEPPSAEIQRRNLRKATQVLGEIARHNSLVVTHGNGPQVGLLAMQSESGEDAPLPLDVLGAQTQGMIGYMIEDELRDELGGRAEVATLLTQVSVDIDDPAFARPTKPIGPVYTRASAERIAEERGWTVAQDGDDWRRVVPSPEPRQVLELRSIEILLEAGVVVVCAGGGGVPVVADGGGGWRGVEAVVDKDLSAAVLADAVGADKLLLLTDVDAVYRDWNTPDSQPIRRGTAAEMRRHRFAEGSMGPKVEAACRFVEGAPTSPTRRPREAFIGALGEAASMLSGNAGTSIRS